MRLAKFSRILLLLALPAVLETCALAQDHPSVQPLAVRDQLTKQAPGVSQPQAGASKVPASKPAAAPAKAPAQERAAVTHRDPFETLLSNARAGNAPPENLPPGKAGLVVGTLRVDGIVRDSAGMIAIVSNPQQRVYFLRDGDKLYDGSVAHITLESVSFHEIGKDAFGKPLERQVTKRLYPSPGEQQ
jgi:Tfp pilus assembly protein PilP